MKAVSYLLVEFTKLIVLNLTLVMLVAYIKGSGPDHSLIILLTLKSNVRVVQIIAN